MEFRLFETNQEKITVLFDTITVDDLYDYFDTVIYQRGQKYYEYGQVKKVESDADNTSIAAIVKGRKEYLTRLFLHEGAVWGKCDCPYGGTCKHIVATFLYAFHSKDKIEIASPSGNTEIVDNYLQSLNKKQLISLVEKYAPKSFYTVIENKLSGNEEALQRFIKIEKKIKNIFPGSDLLYSAPDFEVELNRLIKKLNGLEKHVYKEIENLILFIIPAVDKAHDEGYLYADGYYNDYYQSDVFDTFVVEFITQLPLEEKYSFIEALDEVLTKLSHDTFSGILFNIQLLFREEEIYSLKEMVLKKHKQLSLNLTGKFYRIIHNQLSDTEKEAILLKIKSQHPDILTELAKLYQRNGRIEEAICCLENFINNCSHEFGAAAVNILYLELLFQSKKPFLEIAETSINKSPTAEMLKKIISLLPEKKAVFEKLLENKNANELLEYYETSNRLEEALALIKRVKKINESIVLDFFKKHKKVFRADAELYFRKFIEENLSGTGDYYYASVASGLSQIKKINPILASELAKDIRLNYKRRPKLISMISLY
jgi:tetratricopeptide (TPR) repeat protein